MRYDFDMYTLKATIMHLGAIDNTIIMKIGLARPEWNHDFKENPLETTLALYESGYQRLNYPASQSPIPEQTLNF